MAACPVVQFWAFFEGRNFRTDFGILEVTESIGFNQPKQLLAEKIIQLVPPFLAKTKIFWTSFWTTF